ncbi:MAG: hypothetical protein HY815_23795 [Candidatus Riflebacteria bacterium]|nr:hypothetical protein [Candidatus Riflebacteria bacterium]
MTGRSPRPAPGGCPARPAAWRWALRLVAAWGLASLAWAASLLDPEAGHAGTISAQLPWIAGVTIVAAVASWCGLDRSLARPAQGRSRWRGRHRRKLVGIALSGLGAAALGWWLVGHRPLWVACAALALPLLATRPPFSRLASVLEGAAAAALAWPLLLGALDLIREAGGAPCEPLAVAVSTALRFTGHPDVGSAGLAVHFAGRDVRLDPVRTGLPFAVCLFLTNALVVLARPRSDRNAVGRGLVGAALSSLLLGFVCGFSAVVTLPGVTVAIPRTATLLVWTRPLAAGALTQAVLFLLVAPSAGRRFRLFSPFGFERPAPVPLAWPLLLVAAGTFGWVVDALPGRRAVSIVGDDFHGRWEPFLGSYGRDDQDRTKDRNNYRSLLDYLARFAPVRVIASPETVVPGHLPDRVTVERPTDLARWLSERPPADQVLCVKCVTRPFTDREIDAVVSFVVQGGSLVLIGDHTDALLMNTSINPLATRFGIEFRADSTYMLDGDWIMTSAKDLARHPALAHLSRFYWANGCTLALSPPARPLVWSPWASFTEPARYHEENFFGNKVLDSSDRCGPSVIAATARCGKGKVFAFTDSTCFNNELFFTEGRRELIQGLIGWFSLVREPPPRWCGPALMLAALLLVGRRRSARQAAATLGLALPMALALGIAAADRLDRLASTAPEPTRPLPDRIVVDASHDPRLALTSEAPMRWRPDCSSLLPLIGDLGRTGLFPEVRRDDLSGEGDLAGARLLVIAGPRREYTPTEQDRVRRFVHGGGGLLLIEGAGGAGAIDSVARLFSMELATGRIELQARGAGLVNPTAVMGGRPLVRLGGYAVVAWARHGKGLVVCVGDDRLFSAENGRRDELEVGRMVHDLAAALARGDGTRLEQLPLTETLVNGQPYR